MWAFTQYAQKKVAIIGAGSSGMACARAVSLGLGVPILYDDQAQERTTPSIVVHPPQENAQVNAAIVSPGVPLTHFMVQNLRAQGVPVCGDIEAFFVALKAQKQSAPESMVCMVTGTNGKSTTTALLGHLLQHAGYGCAVGGNIGTNVADLPMPAALQPHPFTKKVHYVLEVSSYQAQTTNTFTPDVGIFLNLTPDHLERHGDMESYFLVKSAPFLRMTSLQCAVVAIDDDYGARLAHTLLEKGINVRTVSAYGHTAHYTAHNNNIYEHGAWIASLKHHGALQGAHNQQNALAAVAAARACGATITDITQALNYFKGLPHRLQRVPQTDVVCINDSKATNAQSTQHALRAYPQCAWIVGGRPKLGGLSALTPRDVAQVQHAFIIGEACNLFAQQLSQLQVPYTVCHTLTMAVDAAWTHCKTQTTESVILFSPACASQDQFLNYAQRGDVFMSLVQQFCQKTP